MQHTAIPVSLLIGLAAATAACRTPDAPPRPAPAGPHADVVAARADATSPALPPIDAASTLDELILHALAVHPDVEAARAELAAAAEEAPIATSLPDPRLSVRAFVEEVQTRVGPQEWAVGLSQRLPWPGRLGRAGDVAAAEARAAAARWDAAALAVVAEVRAAWYELWLLERSVAVVRANLDALDELEEVLSTRYAAGEATLDELLRVQVEAGRLGDRLRGLEDRRRPATARLNAALHRPPDAALPVPRALAAPAQLAADAELARRLETHSPALRELRHRADAAAAGVAVAELERRPDLTFGVEYVATGEAPTPGVPGSGDDPLLLTLAFDLPLRTERDRALERRARARRHASRAMLAAATDRLGVELEQELHAERNAARRVSLYRDTLVPRARQAFRATETSFRGGEASFTALIDAERALLELELGLDRARADRAHAVARLERLVGAPLTPNEPAAPEEVSR